METVDWFVIGFYLVIVMAISFCQKNKMKTMRDYALGDQSFSAFSLFATMSTAVVGANTTLGLSAQSYAAGIIFLFTYFGCLVQQGLVTFAFATKLKKSFPQAMSVGDVMGSLYGKQGQIITGLFSLVFSIGIMSAQIAGMGYIFGFFLRISYNLGCILGCAVVVLYASLGGIRGVINANIFQLVIVTISLSMIIAIGIQEAGGFMHAMQSIPKTHWELFRVMTPGTFMCIFCMRIFGTLLTPAYFQRILAAQSAKSYIIGNSFSIVFCMAIFALSCLAGLISLSLYPNIHPSVAMLCLMNNIFPPVLIGFAVAGLLAVIMSTTDAWLHSSSIALIHDVILPFNVFKINPNQELKVAQATTLILGFLALGFCLSIPDIPSIVLYSFKFWAPTILVPLAFGILGMTIGSRSFLLCLGIGLVTTLLWDGFCAKTTIAEGTLFGLAFHIIVFLVFYYYHKRKKELLPSVPKQNLSSLYPVRSKTLDPIHN